LNINSTHGCGGMITAIATRVGTNSRLVRDQAKLRPPPVRAISAALA